MIPLTKLKTLWSKGKYYISFALVGIAAIVVFFVLKKKDKAWDMVKKIKDNHDKELDIIKKSHQEKIDKKEKRLNWFLFWPLIDIYEWYEDWKTDRS